MINRLFRVCLGVIAGLLFLQGISKPSYGYTAFLELRPQLKYGKIENGNKFYEMQYMKFQYLKDRLIFEGGLSTGFTGPRSGNAVPNHYINRLGLKATYLVNDNIGVFYEGSFTDNIEGQSNPVSYFVTDNYQAIGVSMLLLSFGNNR